MKAIAAVREDWGIGAAGALLARIPGDMAFFRRVTQGGVVIMGHATLRSFPGGRPLKNRVNIVLSRDPSLSVPGAIVCAGVEGLADLLRPYDPDKVFVCGGQAVYEQLLPHCATALITRFTSTEALAADRFFPDLEADPDWTLVQRSEEHEEGAVVYTFCTYENRRPLPLPGG